MHASGDWTRLQAVMGHEFGHQVGFYYGSQARSGPHRKAGRRPASCRPVEAWADCVSGSYISYYPCGGSSQPWTVDWLAPGPGAHQLTA